MLSWNPWWLTCSKRDLKRYVTLLLSGLKNTEKRLKKILRKDTMNMIIPTCLNPKSLLSIPKKKLMKLIFSNWNSNRETLKKSLPSQLRLMESTISLKVLKLVLFKKARNKRNRLPVFSQRISCFLPLKKRIKPSSSTLWR